MEDKKEKIQFILGLAELYGERLTETRLKIYLEVLRDITNPELKKAYMSIINNPWIKKMPLPGEIRNAARPKLDSKDEAIRRINLIKEAVRKFGWPEPKEARAYLGDVWNDVEMLGGWSHICENPELNLNDPIIYAQRRDELKSFVESRRQGITDYQLTGTDHHKHQIGNKEKLGEVIKLASKKSNEQN